MSSAAGGRFTGERRRPAGVMAGRPMPMDQTEQSLRTDDMVTAAMAGDEPAFAALTQRHRRELHVHCYRMLASFDEAEDAVQETFLNAWRGRSGFEGGSQFRAWLYRIATNVCLDMLRRSSRRAAAGPGSPAEVPWIQPYPDALLDQAAPADEQPEAAAIRRETISLTFLAALQVLPPRQRAALIARDVLGWPASETAAALGTSVAAANSALQRARATMQAHLPPSRAEWSVPEPSAQERALLAQFIDAHERLDAEAAIALAARDLRITMPPYPVSFDRPEAIRPLMADAAAMGQWRVLPAAANRMPAAAGYLRRPGDALFRAFKLDVMRMQDGLIAEITTFGAELFPAFGLAPVL
jgi:RNA polymerase sigma-70 factor (ECF subfamily)